MKFPALFPFVAATVFAVVPVSAQQQPLQPQTPAPVGVAVVPQVFTPEGGRQQRPETEAEERQKQILALDPTAPNVPVTTGPPPMSSVTPATPPATVTVPGSRPRVDTKPLEGSVAASSQRQRNPRDPQTGSDTSDTNDPREEYSGPAVLTRAYTLQRARPSQQIKWKYNVGFNETYDTGNVLLQNRPEGLDNLGRQYTWGFAGRQVWKRDAVGLDYAGSWNDYPAQGIRGGNHALSADYRRTVSRRIRFNLVATASSLSQGYTLQNPITSPTNSLADINVAVSPIVQIFDTTTRQVNLSPSVQWDLSSRLSLSFGTSGFAVERQGFGLLGQSGYQASSDVNYRLTKKVTTGLYYNASFYHYEHAIAVSNSHGVGTIFSWALNRSTQLRSRVGLNFFENLGLTTVEIAPEFAALLGTKAGVIDLYRANIFTEISGELVHDFHRNRTATVSYTRGLTPGNGVILAAMQQAVGVGFNMLAFRSYHLSSGLGWTTLNSGIQTTGKYDTQYAYVSLSRPILRRATSDLRFEYRKFAITGYTNTHDQLRLSLGLSWSSGEGHLRPW